MIAVSYLMKRKVKKIFLEVISNNKIFYLKFYSMKLPTTKFLPNLQWDWTTSNTVQVNNIIDIKRMTEKMKNIQNFN